MQSGHLICIDGNITVCLRLKVNATMTKIAKAILEHVRTWILNNKPTMFLVIQTNTPFSTLFFSFAGSCVVNLLSSFSIQFCFNNSVSILHS